MNDRKKEKQLYRKPEVEKRISTEELQRDAKYAGEATSELAEEA